jgi:hypothetical protein
MLRAGFYVLAACVVAILAIIYVPPILRAIGDPFGLKAGQLDQAAADTATAKAEATGAKAQAGFNADAGTIYARGAVRERAIVDQDRRNADALRDAPGADVPLDSRFVAALRRGLCERPTYRDDRACAGLRADDAGVLPDAGAGRTASTP